MREFNSAQKYLAVAFAVIVAFKVAALALLGPIHMPDSAGYALAADLMLADSTWMSEISMANGAEHPTVFRVIGYPLTLALAKAISPSAWDWLVVIFQSALSLIATGYVYRLAKAFSDNVLLAVFAALAHGMGQSFMLDQCILSDSLNATALIIVSCHAGIAIIDNRRPTLVEVAALGALVFAAFLMREAGTYLQVFYWPLIGYWALRVIDRKARMVLMLIVFALPMLVGSAAYENWNQMRTGERFITTGASTAMYLPSVYLEQRGIKVFENDPLLNDMGPLPQIPSTVRAIRTTVIPHLVHEHGLTILDVARHGRAMFNANWLNHPLEMLALSASHLHRKQMELALMPIGTLDRTVLWATGGSAFPAPGQLWRNLRNDHRIDQVLMVAGRTVERLLSMALTAAFLIGAPILLVREGLRERFAVGRYNPAAVMIGLFWLMYCGYTSVYALIYIEVRYLMPVIPLSMIGGIIVLSTLGKMVFPKLFNAEKT